MTEKIYILNAKHNQKLYLHIIFSFYNNNYSGDAESASDYDDGEGSASDAGNAIRKISNDNEPGDTNDIGGDDDAEVGGGTVSTIVVKQQSA